MDGPRFDAWTRTLARGRSRRGALRVLAGGGLGALLAHRAASRGTAQEAQAVCGLVGEPCRVNGECCHGNACRDGTCQCARVNYTNCNGRCRDLRTNENHCGACNTPCEAGQTCCRGRCVDPQTDQLHCGACGNACGREQACAGGACGPACSGGVTTGPTQCCSCRLAGQPSRCTRTIGAGPDACAEQCQRLAEELGLPFFNEARGCSAEAGIAVRCRCGADGRCGSVACGA